MRSSSLSRNSPGSAMTALSELFHAGHRYRHLLFEMTKRELVDPHAGQMLSKFWVIVHPLFVMGLYIFVFGVVFKTRIGGTYDLPLDYTAYLLSGIIPWLSCQQVLSRAPRILSANANLVKQVTFPIEILPLKTVLASFFPEAIGLAALLLHIATSSGFPPITWTLIPIIIVVHLALMLGFAFALAVVGAFARDTSEVIQIFLLAGVYIMPVFYLPSWVPQLFRPLLYLNPFSYLIWVYQDALYFGRIEHPGAWVAVTFMAGTSLVLGTHLFYRLKPFVASIL
jgi:homopolymeric O-antigen transport system permease protein